MSGRSQLVFVSAGKATKEPGAILKNRDRVDVGDELRVGICKGRFTKGTRGHPQKPRMLGCGVTFGAGYVGVDSASSSASGCAR